MSVEFEIKITEKDMYRFNMHHAYTGFQGIFATVIGIAVLAVACITLGKVEGMYTTLYFLFGVIFLVYTPISLKMRSKRQFLVSPALRETMHYTMDEKGIHVAIGEETADLEWNMVYRMVSTKSNLLIYSSRINAYILPRQQLGDKYAKVKELAERKLEKYRLKLK